MKKLFVVLLIAVVIVILAACGGEASSTTQGADMTAPAVTTPATANQVSSTTPATTTGKAPETTLPGIDILYGDEADRAIDPDWNMDHSISFENHHARFQYNWALVVKMVECDNQIYQDIVWTVSAEDADEDTYAGVLNPAYRFVVTFEGQDIEIERFSIYHQISDGYIRMDLGDDFAFPDNSEEKDGFDVWLRIYDARNEEVVYYAWFTDPYYDGLYQFPPSLPPSSIPSYAGLTFLNATPVSGPEGYENLFDMDVKTKLLTSDLATPIVWKYDEPMKAFGYVFVGTGEDALHPERVPTGWKLYGSSDGTDWKMIGGHNLPVIEEASNYDTRYFDASNSADAYEYFKLEFDAPSEYQLSEIAICQEIK